MHVVGFEPTRITTSRLELDPLDHSGIHAYTIKQCVKRLLQFFESKYLMCIVVHIGFFFVHLYNIPYII